MREIPVRLDSASRSYNIRIGPGLLDQAAYWLMEMGLAGRVVVVTNPVMEKLYGAALKRDLQAAGFDAHVLTVPDGEEYKSLEVAGRLFQELTDLQAERSTPILALGGGVTGDLAGFVAATYLRGVPLVQLPTTLLAQVDSSIGGKVAVNHGPLKNRIGAFYQPQMVLCDVSALNTLPVREFANGLAEVIKYGVIGDGGFFDFLEGNLDRLQAFDEDALEETVYRSACIKAAVVEEDETDQGARLVLNFGHTVGHALESVSGFTTAHGEAVALGMLAAARVSHRLGMIQPGEVKRLTGLVDRAGLPTRLPRVPVAQLTGFMQLDKKVVRGHVRFVLPRAMGSVFISDAVSLSLVEEVLTRWHDET